MMRMRAGNFDQRGAQQLAMLAHLQAHVATKRSPFAGEGANLAMFDSAELGKAIAKNSGEMEAALGAYEAELFRRSASAAAEAERNLTLCFDENAPHGLLNLFSQPSTHQ